jgi:methionyl aminopeptidase
MKKNAKIHKKVFEKIEEIVKPWTKSIEINNICGEIAQKHWVLCGFKWLYNFPDNICISVNNEVVHGRANRNITFKEGDLVTFDFGIKDKQKWINTDAAISLIVGWNTKNPKWARLIEANKKALYAWIKAARAWAFTWNIWAAIQAEIEWAWYKVVKDLTGHAIWKKLHETPYIPNFWKAGKWAKLKVWMTLAIEPILWETSWRIIDKWDFEIYIADGSLGCQYEHTILITESEAEIII